MHFEVEIIKALQSIRNSVFDYLFDAYAALGTVWIVIIVGLLVFFLYDKKIAVLFGLCEGAAALTSLVIKHVVKRPRPFVSNSDIVNIGLEKGYSFPSGHLTSSIVIAVFVLFLCFHVFKRRGKIVSAVLIALYLLLMILDRMYLGVHYLTDTLAGIAVGGIWAAVALMFLPEFSNLWNMIFGKFAKKGKQQPAELEDSSHKNDSRN